MTIFMSPPWLLMYATGCPLPGLTARCFEKALGLGTEREQSLDACA
jgi:hypothetical protein